MRAVPSDRTRRNDGAPRKRQMRRPITAFALAGLCVLATAAGAETASTGLAPFKIVAVDGSDAIPDPLTDKPGMRRQAPRSS